MSRLLTAAVPGIAVNGQPTEVKHGDFGSGKTVSDYFVTVTGMVPANAHYQLSLYFGATVADGADINNLAGGTPVPIGVSKGATLKNASRGTADYGLSYDFTAFGGGGANVIYRNVAKGLAGFWSGGFTVLLAANPVANMSMVCTLEIGEEGTVSGSPDEDQQPARDLRGSPTPGDNTNEPWNITLSWTLPETKPLDATTVVYRSERGRIPVAVGTVAPGGTSFIDRFPNLTPDTIYTYYIRIWEPIPDTLSPPTPPIDVYYPPYPLPNYIPPNPYAPPYTPPTSVPGGTPTITMTSSGGVDLGGTATMKFMANPSGIYTLVKNKRYDTVYERMTGIDSVDLKIPKPFAKTGYLG